MASLINANTSGGLISSGDTSGVLKLQTASTDAVTIDSAQNVGVGVTPSAWGSTLKAVEVGGGNSYLAFNNTSASGYMYWNMYNDGSNNKTKINGYIGAYGFSVSGAHVWFNGTGTAGATSSLTQAMTLDASGNLGIGTTSPSAKLHVQNQIYVKGTGGGDGSIGIDINSGGSAVTTGAHAIRTGGGAGNSLIIETETANSNGQILLQTNGSERVRIDSSGNLLVGTTSGTNHKLVKNTSDGYACTVENSTTGNPYGLLIYYSGKSGLSTANELYLKCQDSTATRMYLTSSGGIANYQANNANLSDRREKTDFSPAGSYLDKICSIPVQTYKYIDQSDDELTLGVVAQDVQAVAPELVTESNWGTPEEPKIRLSIYQTDLQYALMKALQELKAEFDAYKATHP
jgi:Chaperone of endosialidase